MELGDVSGAKGNFMLERERHGGADIMEDQTSALVVEDLACWLVGFPGWWDVGRGGYCGSRGVI